MSEEMVGSERPFRGQEADPDWNREPGIVPIPGSNFSKEMNKFEQFPSRWNIGTSPGRPYSYKPFPKMLYRAERYPGTGQITCMAAPPDPLAFRDHREFDRMEQAAMRFTEKCQLVVNDEREMTRAMESGWRESPAEAVEYVMEKDKSVTTAAAHREYEDRNMSEPAKREIAAAVAKSQEPILPEVPQAPKSRTSTKSK